MKIDSGEVNASISVDDTVTFTDTVAKFSKADVENALAQAQEQAKLLFELEKAMQLNKEYLTKVRSSPSDSYFILCLYNAIGLETQGRRSRRRLWGRGRWVCSWYGALGG